MTTCYLVKWCKISSINSSTSVWPCFWWWLTMFCDDSWQCLLTIVDHDFWRCLTMCFDDCWPYVWRSCFWRLWPCAWRLLIMCFVYLSINNKEFDHVYVSILYILYIAWVTTTTTTTITVFLWFLRAPYGHASPTVFFCDFWEHPQDTRPPPFLVIFESTLKTCDPHRFYIFYQIYLLVIFCLLCQIYLLVIFASSSRLGFLHILPYLFILMLFLIH
jgi:hypothetical protein